MSEVGGGSQTNNSILGAFDTMPGMPRTLDSKQVHVPDIRVKTEGDLIAERKLAEGKIAQQKALLKSVFAGKESSTTWGTNDEKLVPGIGTSYTWEVAGGVKVSDSIIVSDAVQRYNPLFEEFILTLGEKAPRHWRDFRLSVFYLSVDDKDLGEKHNSVGPVVVGLKPKEGSRTFATLEDFNGVTEAFRRFLDEKEKTPSSV